MKMPVLALMCLLVSQGVLAENSWKFAVSGDSRNCGDVVMPALAAEVKKEGAEFYWHLGDLRAIFAMDEDIAQRASGVHPGSLAAYQNMAWQDFQKMQVEPFGDMPFFLGIGNHETIPPKTRAEFVSTFRPWLDSSELHRQREKDGDPTVKTYFHWEQGNVDFIYLDNASADEFDAQQVAWFEKVLRRDKDETAVKAVVVGMHAALPNSLAAGHSMNNWKTGESSGEKVYSDLLDFRNQSKKNVYVLASHSHFYMKGIFDTEYWKSRGSVLPGWIIGTAGAHRYALPEDARRAAEAKTNVYGYLLGTVHDDGNIDFKFHEIKAGQVPQDLVPTFGEGLMHTCFNGNSDVRR
jgi:hypothetical protein